MSGITVYEQKRYFADAFPNGTNVYVALFTSLPNSAGEGGIECAEAWYARKAHQQWVSTVIGTSVVRRSNVGAIEMAAVGGGDPDVTIVGWGVYDAATDGNLRWAGPLRDAGGVETPITLSTPDQLRWTEGELIAQLKPTTDQTESMLMEQITPATTTVNATPATQDIVTLADEEAIHLEVEIVAKGTNGGSDSHYYRKIRASYDRDDGGSGTDLWSLREQTADGPDTRINLATATGELIISGNVIQSQYTGMAAATLTWYTRWRKLTDVAPT